MKTLIDWEQKFEEVRQEEKRIQYIKNNLEEYVQNVLSKNYQGVNIGLVYTKLEEEIQQNRFMIWLERSNGLHMDHKYFDIPSYILEN